MVLAECIHSWDDVRSSGDVVSLLQRAALALVHLLHLLLEPDEEEGDLPDPRKAFHGGQYGSVPYSSILSQLDASLGRLADPDSEPKVPFWKWSGSRYLSKHRLVNNDKPLPMGQGCINEIIIILSIDGDHNPDASSLDVANRL